jgi:D123
MEDAVGRSAKRSAKQVSHSATRIITNFSTIRQHGILSCPLSNNFGNQISKRYGNLLKTVCINSAVSLLSILSYRSSMADTFDLLLTRDLTRAHILDFNPYAPRTDSLLFTYDDLFNLLSIRNIEDGNGGPPELRIIDSRMHPAATSNAPTHQHNMVPFEALSMSNGRDIEEFAALWRKNVQENMDE